MNHWQQEYGGRGEVGGRRDDQWSGADASGEQARQSSSEAIVARARGRGMMAEIEESMERLERTHRQGKITPDEFAEVRDVLELQRRQVGTDR